MRRNICNKAYRARAHGISNKWFARNATTRYPQKAAQSVPCTLWRYYGLHSKRFTEESTKWLLTFVYLQHGYYHTYSHGVPFLLTATILCTLLTFYSSSVPTALRIITLPTLLLLFDRYSATLPLQLHIKYISMTKRHLPRSRQTKQSPSSKRKTRSTRGGGWLSFYKNINDTRTHARAPSALSAHTHEKKLRCTNLACLLFKARRKGGLVPTHPKKEAAASPMRGAQDTAINVDNY